MPIRERRGTKSKRVPGQLVLGEMAEQEPVFKHERSEPEFLEQRTLFYWLDTWAKNHPELHFVHAIPNGLALTPRTAVKAKQQGVTSGIWDIFVPCVRKGSPGLYIEMKAGRNKLTTEQQRFRAHCLVEGYKLFVSYSWVDAAAEIVEYLGIKDEMIERALRINTNNR